MHLFKRGSHHRYQGGWQHRHKGPLRATRRDSDEEEDSPVSSMAGAFCKPTVFLPPQAMKDFTVSQNEESPIVRLKFGNIVADNAEALAAPCDPYLHHDGGCVGAINVASQGLLQSLCNAYLQKHGKMSTGKAVAFEVGGGRLRCKHIICVVGPHSVQDTQDRVRALLRVSCCSVLQVALDLKVATLAVPSISAGAYKVNPKVSKHLALYGPVLWFTSE